MAKILVDCDEFTQWCLVDRVTIDSVELEVPAELAQQWRDIQDAFEDMSYDIRERVRLLKAKAA